MISRIIKKTVDLSKIQKVDQLEGPLYQLENGGHTFEITCLMDGAAAAVSGTVSARFLRADEETVYFTGTLTGNVVSITLPQSCYVSNGRFGLVVFVSGNDITSAVYAVAGNVYRSTSDHIIDPTEEIPSLEDLIAKIGECEEATEAAEAAASTANSAAAAAVGNFATDYANLTFPVEVGTHCTHGGNYYVAKTQIDSSEAWTAAHWTQVTAGAEIGDLKSAFETGYTSITSTDLEVGGWDETGNKISVYGNKAVRTKQAYPVKTGDYIETVPGETALYWTGMVISNGTVVESWGAGTYRASIANSKRVFTADGDLVLMFANGYNPGNSTAIIPADMTAQVHLVTSEIVKQTSGLPAAYQAIDSISQIKKIALSGEPWEVGSITGGGANTRSSVIIRTQGYIPVDGFQTIEFTVDSGYKFGWHFYNESNTHISSASAYISNNSLVPVPSGAKYLRVNMGKTTDTTADVTWAEHLTMSAMYPIVEQAISLQSFFGTGTNTYSGKKIDLHMTDTTCRCDIALWKSYTTTEYPSLADYHLYTNQSVAIYNGYMFLLNGDGTVAVVDYETKDFLDVVSLETTYHNHQNAAQFGSIFYDPGDEFPLLFVSRCGNSQGQDVGLDSCLVYRITRSNNDFTFTKINTITTDIITYGNSWFVDVNDLSIGFVGYVNGTYSVTENNPIYVYKWRMPLASAILSGETITLLKADLIGQGQFEHKVLQSCCAYAGKLFIAIGMITNLYVYVYDIRTGYVESIVPLVSASEVEGVCVYDNKLFVTHAKGNSTSTEQLQIYQITF